MKRWFADTFFFIALLNERDDAHEPAMALVDGFRGQIITTRWVLAELANAMAAPLTRNRCAAYLRFLETDEDVEIIGNEGEFYKRGLRLYEDRPDKGWSLTDCISFVVMQRKRIKESMTGDHHFEQVGFVALLK